MTETIVIEGVLQRVTFWSETTGFGVLKFDVSASGADEKIITATGSFPSAIVGESMRLFGQWIEDKKYGRQFKVENVQAGLPSTIQGMRAYLASGVIKGVGPKYAGMIAEKFKDKIFDVLDNNSDLLETIPGIGPERRARIENSWREHRVIRSLMVWLYEHGIGTARAWRIHKKYGSQALEKIKSDPYILAREIPGIGFKTADQVALKSGLGAAHPHRVRIPLGSPLISSPNPVFIGILSRQGFM